MLSRFFGKSKPIHYIIVGCILLMIFILANYLQISQPFTVGLAIKQTFLFALCMFTIFLFDFLTSRNKLTKKNSYDILLFTLFIALLPQTILNSNILISHVFILLALRRIISLRSGKDIKKKLLDASIWMSMATLFYFWSGLFFILIFLALIFYAIADIKNWVIPILGMLCVVIISLSYFLITNQDYELFYRKMFDYSFDFSTLNDMGLIIGSALLLSYGNWALFFYIKKLNTKQKRYRPAFLIMVFAEIIALAIIAVTPDKNGSEFLFLFAPLAVIMTNYLESIQEKWFKEMLIWALVITSMIIFFI